MLITTVQARKKERAKKKIMYFCVARKEETILVGSGSNAGEEKKNMVGIVERMNDRRRIENVG